MCVCVSECISEYGYKHDLHHDDSSNEASPHAAHQVGRDWDERDEPTHQHNWSNGERIVDQTQNSDKLYTYSEKLTRRMS